LLLRRSRGFSSSSTTTTTTTTTSATAGAFALPGLRRPADCARLARVAASTSDGLVERIVAQAAAPTLGVLHRLDELSEQLCLVLDAMELCRNVHPEAEWAEAADEAYAWLAGYMQTLNTEPRLHGAVDALLRAPGPRAGLGAEQLRFARGMAAEFEHDGVHLGGAERARLNSLHAQAERLAAQFGAGGGAGFGGGAGASDEGRLLQLQRLLEVRHEIATALGHQGWAAYACAHHRMEPEPQAVEEALVKLLRRLQPHAEAEATAPAAAFAAAPVAADAADEAELSRYLGVQGCLNGLEGVLARSFGLRLLRAEAAEGELWHPSVRKLLLTRRGAAVGVLYLDLFGRPRKTRQAALYTLRAGITAARRATGMAAAAGAPASAVAASRELQLSLPAAALVCSLPAPADGSAAPPTLSVAALETLYHEVGHALHALLSRTEFQHHSGVRVPMDFVEVPSLLMENFAREPAVLCSWATHERSGAPLPPQLAEAATRARATRRASEWQRQALRALVDLRLHADASHAPPERSAALAHKLATRHALGGPAAAHAPLGGGGGGGGARWLAGFSHLASYGAGYYSYLWARSLSKRVWRSLFAADPLRAGAGARWCDEVLVHGNAREPRAMLRGLLLARDAAAADTTRPTPLAASDVGAAAGRADDAVEAALLELVPLDEPVRRGGG